MTDLAHIARYAHGATLPPWRRSHRSVFHQERGEQNRDDKGTRYDSTAVRTTALLHHSVFCFCRRSLLSCYIAFLLPISLYGPQSTGDARHNTSPSSIAVFIIFISTLKPLLLALNSDPLGPIPTELIPTHGGPRRVLSSADVPGDGEGGTPVASLPVHLVVSSPSVSNRAVDAEGQAHGRRGARRLRAVTAARLAQSRQRVLLAGS